MVTLEGVAQLLHLLGRAACLVDEVDLDFEAAEADLVIRLITLPALSASITVLAPSQAGFRYWT